ncbi:hypothetical protein SFC07_11065 [Corynebacterium callunae]|uniref:hypothetical protein n=1 Tax=Corynebacterium callunae TaxID=1721 RepID=UPI0039819941
MSDENPTVDDAQAQATDNSTGQSSPEDIAAQLAATQAELEAKRAKIAELAPLAEAARAAEEAKKSELEKLQEAQALLQSEKALLAEENTKLRLAQTYGLASEDLGLLGSGSSEGMEANAKRLQELHAAAAKAVAAPSNRPIDSMKPGASQKSDAGAATAYPSHWR